MNKNTEKNCRLGVVGGQAVLEGVMMKHKDRYSVAVRLENGDITVQNDTFESCRKKHKILNIPILRGVVNMVEMMMLSFKTLNISAELYGYDENEKEESEKWGKFSNVLMVGSFILAMFLAVGLFVLIPSFITTLIDRATNYTLAWGWKNLIEGVLKIGILILYLELCSLLKDMKRTFEYHGAEHKSIFCYEAGLELTPENAKKFKRFHPRCGTSFVFVIFFISVVISSLPIVPWDNIFLRMLVKILLLPLVVGIGFEFIMYAGKHDNLLVKILSAPGLWMQRITTREPDLEQLEVAIHALKSSMPDEFPDYVPPKIEKVEKEPACSPDEIFEKSSKDSKENTENSENCGCDGEKNTENSETCGCDGEKNTENSENCGCDGAKNTENSETCGCDGTKNTEKSEKNSDMGTENK